MDTATFKDELQKAANTVVEQNSNSAAHLIRQAFYAGVEWEMTRRGREAQNAAQAAKANDPSA